MSPTVHVPATSAPLRSELGELLRLAWPVTSAQLALVAMGLVDTAVLGRVSVADLAGAAIGRNVGLGVASLTMGVGMGLEALASQALGANEPARAWGALVASVKACMLLWIPVACFGLGITFALEPMGVAHDMVARARSYLYGQLPGLGLYGVFIAGRTFLQAHGNARPALIAALVANVVNFAVCSLLVRGDDALRAVGLPPIGLPVLGAFGAGLATTVAELVLVAITMRAAFLVHGRRPSEAVPIRTALRVGMPIGLQLFAEMGIFATIALVSGRLGETVASAHQVAIGLASFTFMGALGVSAATAVQVGRAVGEGKSPRRVGLVGIAAGAGVQGIGAIVFAAFPRALVGIFTDDAEVLTLGADLVLIAAVFQLFDGMQGVASGALRGAGDVRFAFLANLVAYWVLGLPVAIGLAFGLGWGARGLWWGMTFALVLVSLVLAGRFAVLSRRPISRIDRGAGAA